MPAFFSGRLMAVIVSMVMLLLAEGMSEPRLAWSVEPLAPSATVEPQADQRDARGGEEREPPQTYMGRPIAPPMHYSGADWLTRASRVREEDPGKLLDMLGLEKGQVICDFGCGNGYHTLQLANRIGPDGSVHAVDIQQEMLDLLAARAAPRGLQNIKPTLATAADAGLPRGAFDLVLMVDVYHELSHPAEVLASVRASLKGEGRLAVVEFREEDPAVPIRPLHKMSQRQVMKEIGANEFKLVGQSNELPWQHVLLFAHDDSPLPTVDLNPWEPN